MADTTISATTPDTGVDPDDLATCLRVIAELDDLPADHPDVVTVRRATGRLYKVVRKNRKRERQQAVREADAAVLAKTATAAPGRIDDETQGLPLRPAADGASAGNLLRSQACYICKEHYTQVDVFYHQLCPACAARSHERRDARTDLTGRRALLTGGRAKIGMYIALRLLRDGAHTTITTRFPRDAARRFAAMPDSAQWLDRLDIIGIDLRDPGQVIALADTVAAHGHLDILINNAAQTVRRSPESYALLAAAEAAPLPGGPLPQMRSLGPAGGDGRSEGLARAASAHWSPTPEALTALALTAGSASPERVASGQAIDAGGLVPDLHEHNSWSQRVDEV
ncbi:MAG TPA: SDR family NAD(P)-dependent oxidoreductase, partial [Solirubrobacteraceae bacterium]|nr:SDR family NAD(P)-dependent oxidoreductase [Solirubrobacteraceae bacterium]